ncbi:protein teflon isoform X2 [Drosophila novamexicana]|uniref:protein teflon isoform X2 n=1 Tax=Drosophila novamexicana TaxID=47314 RepID=UPI0011E5C371|nr:protein teflon isoform X2 [Drosophila novamexicana]
MSSFLNLLSDDCVNFEKCGDVIVSTKDNMIGIFCHFCCDIYTNLSEFLHHLQWMHNNLLGFTKPHNVYTVEELMAQEDAQTQANLSSNSSDSGLPADAAAAAEATCLERGNSCNMETEPTNQNICKALSELDYRRTKTINKNATVLQWRAEDKCMPLPLDAETRDILAEVEALLAEPDPATKDKVVPDTTQPQAEDETEQGSEVQPATLPYIDEQHKEQPKTEHLVNKRIPVDTTAASPKTTDCKVNNTHTQLEEHNSKSARRSNLETTKLKSAKYKSTCDYKSYAIARSIRKRQQQQRLNNIKKRIVRSLENDSRKLQHVPVKPANVETLIEDLLRSNMSQQKQMRPTEPGAKLSPTKIEDKLKIKPKLNTQGGENSKLIKNTTGSSTVEVILTVSEFRGPIAKDSALINPKSNPNSALVKKIKADDKHDIVKGTENVQLKTKLEPNTSSQKQDKENAAVVATLSSKPSIKNSSSGAAKKSVEQIKDPAPINLKSRLNSNPNQSVQALVQEIKADERKFLIILNDRKGKSLAETKPNAADLAKHTTKMPAKNVHTPANLNSEKPKTSRSDPIVINKIEILPKLNINDVHNSQLTKINPQTQQKGPMLGSSQAQRNNNAKKTAVKRRSSVAVDRDTTISSKMPIRRPSYPVPSTKSSRLQTFKREPLKPETNANKRKQAAKHITDSSKVSVEAKRTKIDHSTSDCGSLSFNLSDSVVEFLQCDLKTLTNADSLLQLAEPGELERSDGEVSEHEQKQALKQQKATEIKTNPDPKELRNDLYLLRAVGLTIIKDANYEELKTIEFVDALRSRAAKFVIMLRKYTTKIKHSATRFNKQLAQNIVKELLMFTEEVNAEFKINLNVCELKRILNLINAWHAQQIDLKFFKKITLTATIEHYMKLFAFMPKINSCVYYCEWCEESSRNKSRYEKHRLIHLYRSICPHCKRVFKKQGCLLNHLRTTHGQEQ